MIWGEGENGGTEYEKNNNTMLTPQNTDQNYHHRLRRHHNCPPFPTLVDAKAGEDIGLIKQRPLSLVLTTTFKNGD